MKLLPDKFVLAIAGAVLLAYIFPQIGAPGSPVPINTIASFGIGLIFFFYGLKLSPDKIRSGLKNWKLHVLIQGSTFILFPLVVLATKPFISEDQHDLWLATFFLATLPSTVSASVVMVSIAKGNMPAAIFNASISGVLGIIFTPLWMSLFIHQHRQSTSYAAIYEQLIVQIILPLAAGLIMQKKWHAWAVKNSKRINFFDKSVIFLIVYKSFSASFTEHVFADIELTDILMLVACVLLLFAAMYAIIFLIATLLRFTKEDRTAALFCGSKKSLIHGTVFSKVLFGNMAGIGVMLLPLMLFHASQILIVSTIAAKLEKDYEGLPLN
jgi:sodium/bile acid cotransporter 7